MLAVLGAFHFQITSFIIQNEDESNENFRIKFLQFYYVS